MNIKPQIVFCLLLAGCSAERDGAAFSGEGEAPVSVTTSLDSDFLQSRADVSAGSIGVFLSSAGGYKPQYNVQYSYSGGWKASAPVYVGAPNATLHAYYPYSASAFAANSTTCTLTAQKYDAAKELYYASASSSVVNSVSPTAAFAMARAYSRIKLSIQKQGYGGNCNITNVNLKSGTGFYAGRTLNISNGTNGGSVTNGGWTYALNTGNMAENATNTAYDVLVPPQPVASGLAITLTVDGVNRSITVPATQFTSNSLAAGLQYTIGLKVTASGLTIGTSVYEQAWNTTTTAGTVTDSSGIN